MKYYLFIVVIALASFLPKNVFAQEVSTCSTYVPDQKPSSCIYTTFAEARSLLFRGSEGYENVISMVNGIGAALYTSYIPYANNILNITLRQIPSNSLLALQQNEVTPIEGEVRIASGATSYPVTYKESVQKITSFLTQVIAILNESTALFTKYPLANLSEVRFKKDAVPDLSSLENKHGDQNSIDDASSSQISNNDATIINKKAFTPQGFLSPP